MKKTLFLFLVCFLATEVFPQNFFQNGEIGIILSGAGRVRVYKDSTTVAALRQIDRSSILVGAGPNAVFGYNQDAINVDPVVSIQNPQLSDFEIYGAADNSFNTPPRPPNVMSKVNIYGWLTGGFTLVKFRILNKETTPISATVGMEIIAQINGGYGLESVKWLSSEKIVSLYRTGENSFVGYKILSGQISTLKIIDWYAGYDTVDTDLWNWITAGTIDTLFDSGGDGAVTFFSQNSVNVPVGDSTTFWVGISVGDSQSEMISNMQLAQQKYNQVTHVESEFNNIPSDYVLKQNYPNPFNPSTQISFGLPQRSSVVLKVFNTLGQEVAELVNESLEAGTHSFNFDASKLTSGIYIYSLKTDAGVISKKMTLVK